MIIEHEATINNNNYIRVRKSDRNYRKLLNELKVLDESDKNHMNYIDLYCIDASNGDLMVPLGYYQYLSKEIHPNQYPIIEYTTSNESTRNLDPKFYRDLSDKVTLYPEQQHIVDKMLKHRRGIIQAATGIGKTECIAGFLKAIKHALGYYPNTVILEPTSILVKGTMERLASYGIESRTYKSSRGNLEGVVVTHPSSLNNDLKANPDLLKDVKIFLSDEGHHLKADTWNLLINSAKNLEYSICLTAMIIEPKHQLIRGIADLTRLTIDEAIVVGSSGPLLVNIPPYYCIKKSILAEPILYRFENSGNEYGNSTNWAKLRKYAIQSASRTKLIRSITAYLASNNFKSLILVGTKNYAHDLMKSIAEVTGPDLVRCSFGGGLFYRYDPISDSSVSCRDEDTMELYKSGKIKILIGTSHLYEGADVPDLDAVILSEVGRSIRKYIQGVGRGLRRSKTGRFAHIFDFTDHKSGVLNHHSSLRRSFFESYISSKIYDNITFPQFKQIFSTIESDALKEDNNGY